MPSGSTRLVTLCHVSKTSHVKTQRETFDFDLIVSKIPIHSQPTGFHSDIPVVTSLTISLEPKQLRKQLLYFV